MRALLACSIVLVIGIPAMSATPAPKRDRETCVKLVQVNPTYRGVHGWMNRQAGPAIRRCMRGEQI